MDFHQQSLLVMQIQPEAITHPKMPHSTGLSPPVKIDADPSTRKYTKQKQG
jgi:hypothetical protein